jgi:hypothetical protein
LIRGEEIVPKKIEPVQDNSPPLFIYQEFRKHITMHQWQPLMYLIDTATTSMSFDGRTQRMTAVFSVYSDIDSSFFTHGDIIEIDIYTSLEILNVYLLLDMAVQSHDSLNYDRLPYAIGTRLTIEGRILHDTFR